MDGGEWIGWKERRVQFQSKRKLTVFYFGRKGHWLVQGKVRFWPNRSRPPHRRTRDSRSRARAVFHKFRHVSSVSEKKKFTESFSPPSRKKKNYKITKLQNKSNTPLTVPCAKNNMAFVKYRVQRLCCPRSIASTSTHCKVEHQTMSLRLGAQT